MSGWPGKWDFILRFIQGEKTGLRVTCDIDHTSARSLTNVTQGYGCFHLAGNWIIIWGSRFFFNSFKLVDEWNVQTTGSNLWNKHFIQCGKILMTFLKVHYETYFPQVTWKSDLLSSRRRSFSRGCFSLGFLSFTLWQFPRRRSTFSISCHPSLSPRCSASHFPPFLLQWLCGEMDAGIGRQQARPTSGCRPGLPRSLLLPLGSTQRSLRGPSSSSRVKKT